MDKLTKNDIGKKFWVEPTGNNISRSKRGEGNEPKEIIILQMKRVKGAFAFIQNSASCGKGFSHSVSSGEEFSLSEHSQTDLSVHINCGFNGGYHVYKSLEDYEIAKKSRLAATFISNK